jgi:eukaryotic-like serine/threonine-protein kinase
MTGVDSPAAPGLVGTRIGRYQLDTALSGGMGAVYRAHDVETGAPVVVKRVFAAGHANRFTLTACKTEARLLSFLRHPRVAVVVDHFHDPDGGYTLVTEWVPGFDLQRALWDRGNPGLPVVEVLERARETCEALAYIHSQQVVHADLKPANIVCGTDGSVLVDFGLAVQVGEHGGPDSVGGGTARFMAPEVFAGDPPTQRSDVYSLAATIWHLVSGKPPVYGEDTPLADTVRGVSNRLERALRAGLQVRPEQRIASAEEFAAELGMPLGQQRGASLTLSVEDPGVPRDLIEALVRTAAAIFEAASVSIALADPDTGELRYVAVWGAVAKEVLDVRVPAGHGIVGSAVENGLPEAVPSCANDPRFARQLAGEIGYMPLTMLVVPLLRGDRCVGALQIVDRRDGGVYSVGDLPRAVQFGELAAAALQ